MVHGGRYWDYVSEELPALWAQAGAPQQALQACGGCAARLWRRALKRRRLRAADWRAVESLEEYRRGRLVWDLVRTGVSVSSRRVVEACR